MRGGNASAALTTGQTEGQDRQVGWGGSSAQHTSPEARPHPPHLNSHTRLHSSDWVILSRLLSARLSRYASFLSSSALIVCGTYRSLPLHRPAHSWAQRMLSDAHALNALQTPQQRARCVAPPGIWDRQLMTQWRQSSPSTARSAFSSCPSTGWASDSISMPLYESRLPYREMWSIMSTA